MSSKLDSYLRTHRLRAGLSQKEIAFLFSLKSTSPISKLEKKHRMPNIEMLLAYCILFDTKPEELIPGLFRRIDQVVVNRASLLIKHLKKQGDDQNTRRKIEFLQSITNKGRSF